MLFSENWGLELFSVLASYENSSTGSLGLRGPHPVICTLSCWWRDSWLKRLVMVTLSLCVLVNWDLIECALRRVKWWSAWFGGVRMNGDASVKDLHLLKWLVIWTWCCKEVRMETHLSVCVAVSVLCLAPPQQPGYYYITCGEMLFIYASKEYFCCGFCDCVEEIRSAKISVTEEELVSWLAPNL